MNRIEFVQSIKRDNSITLADIVVNFFDQYMFLYDLVDTVDSVSIIDHNTSSISFRLDYSTKEPVEQLQEKLYNIPIAMIYGLNYYVRSSRIEDNSIMISISK